jgi:3-oxoacyl-[acyl-carrier protein] reductase
MTASLTAEQSSAMMERIPLGRMGNVEEIAATVSFFASENAGYINGETNQVNCGV